MLAGNAPSRTTPLPVEVEAWKIGMVRGLRDEIKRLRRYVHAANKFLSRQEHHNHLLAGLARGIQSRCVAQIGYLKAAAEKIEAAEHVKLVRIFEQRQARA